MREFESQTVRSSFRNCTAICGIIVDVAGAEAVRVRGDTDRPLSEGSRSWRPTCTEGVHPDDPQVGNGAGQIEYAVLGQHSADSEAQDESDDGDRVKLPQAQRAGAHFSLPSMMVMS